MIRLSKMIRVLAGRCGWAALPNNCAHAIRVLPILFDPYRPELHYMRGPGPKWHAKHDPAPALR